MFRDKLIEPVIMSQFRPLQIKRYIECTDGRGGGVVVNIVVGWKKAL